MKKPSEILIGARELLANPLNWTKEYYAFNQFKEQREAHDEDASCFCMVGACARAAGMKTGTDLDEDPYEVIQAPEIIYLTKATGVDHIPSFNDDSQRTHAEVIAAFDKAIELAQKDGN